MVMTKNKNPSHYEFKLIFSPDEINKWAEAYESMAKNKKNGSDWKLETDVIESIAPRVKNNGYIQKEDFLKVCRWKSARPRKHHEGNSPELIEEITRIALSPKTSDELKIKALTLLSGIKWPMASVFLHFFDEQRYPILDFRALSSLSIPEPKNGYDVLYDYPF